MEESKSLSLVALPESEWKGFVRELKELKSVLLQKQKDEDLSQWIESTEARKMLGVSPKTWQTYRDKRYIPFAQFGRKIFVKKADLDAFMEKHYIAARGGNIA